MGVGHIAAVFARGGNPPNSCFHCDGKTDVDADERRSLVCAGSATSSFDWNICHDH